MLLVVATALGFIYSAAKERGIFARTAPLIGGIDVGTNTPSMISAEEAWSLFQTKSALFIDSRHDFDFKIGHIKGAVNIPLNEFDGKKALLENTSKEQPLVAYCDGAECNSSIELAVKLANNGFKNVRIFFDGWREWRDANHPIEKSP